MIDVRGFDRLRTVTTEVAESKIVGVDEDDVRLGGRRGGG
jgi:hypothetical protein